MYLSQLYRKITAGLALTLLATSAMALEYKIQSLQVAKPDLTISYVKRINSTPGKLKIYVKNIGSATAHAGNSIVSAINMSGGLAANHMQTIAPGKSSYLYVTFDPARLPKSGDKIRVIVDSNKQISESNETNNEKYFTY